MHNRLQFASGAYYIHCQECDGKWVAVTNWNDAQPDYSRGQSTLSGQALVRVPSIIDDGLDTKTSAIDTS